jgi:DNA-binding NarL/FixJ family response regulator
MRILLAEPHVKVLRALQALISEKTEHRIVGEASNLEVLLLQVENTKPDLVLLDWDLPSLTSQKLKKAANARADFPRLIVMSSQKDIEEEALDSGADAFIDKCLPPSKLVEALTRIQDELDK